MVVVVVVVGCSGVGSGGGLRVVPHRHWVLEYFSCRGTQYWKRQNMRRLVNCWVSNRYLLCDIYIQSVLTNAL